MVSSDNTSNVALLDLQSITDEKGALTVLESGKNIPFDIKRVYCLHSLSSEVKRGFHAHLKLKQVAVCTSGSCTIQVEYAGGKADFELNNQNKALYMDGLVWREIGEFSKGAVLMVLADALYDESDYIRNYAEFKTALNHRLSSKK